VTQRLERKLLADVARASSDFGLLEPGDRVLVAVSGGKDSHALLYLLRELERKAPFSFSFSPSTSTRVTLAFRSACCPSTSSARATSTG
jgi:3'-phosphoadenosine 5'-phosphosulfate sulfotransferase (PAPS reductase)/FAD synthetase